VIKNRKLNRLKTWDYSGCGCCFITICVAERWECFGEIKNNRMILNKYGKIVDRQINWVKNHFGNLRLGKYGVMPNHVHLILKIDNLGRDNPRIVPTGLNENYVYSRRHNTLSKIINALKTTSSKSIHLAGLKSFKWQRSFYDHIIKNEKELEKIREYVAKNPKIWCRDRNFVGKS